MIIIVKIKLKNDLKGFGTTLDLFIISPRDMNKVRISKE